MEKKHTYTRKKKHFKYSMDTVSLSEYINVDENLLKKCCAEYEKC